MLLMVLVLMLIMERHSLWTKHIIIGIALLFDT